LHQKKGAPRRALAVTRLLFSKSLTTEDIYGCWILGHGVERKMGNARLKLEYCGDNIARPSGVTVYATQFTAFDFKKSSGGWSAQSAPLASCP
jgi:hypothetical protein